MQYRLDSSSRLYFSLIGVISCNTCRECSRLMVAFHQKAGTGKLTGVHRKYSTSKFGYAARIQPANFLLEAKDWMTDIN